MRKVLIVVFMIVLTSCCSISKYGCDDVYILGPDNEYIDLSNYKEFTLLNRNFYGDTCLEGKNCFSLNIVYSFDLNDTFLIYDFSRLRFESNELVIFTSNGRRLHDYEELRLPSLTIEKAGRERVLSEVYSNKYKYCIGSLSKK